MFTHADRYSQIVTQHHQQLLAEASRQQLRHQLRHQSSHQDDRRASRIPAASITRRLATVFARTRAVTADAPSAS
jgi:uncharacterized membrane protein